MAANRPTRAGIPPAAATVTALHTPGRVRTKLDSVNAILRELGRLYRSARAGAIPVNEAASLAWILHTMAKLHESVIFEQRLTALERREETDGQQIRH